MTVSKFEKGISGNPAGRPKNKTPATMLRKSIAKDMPAIINVLISMAKDGDVAAAKVLIDRVCPVLKPQSLELCLPAIDSLSGQGNEIIKATLSGQIPPDTGLQLIAALSNQAKIIKIDELTKRIESLEKQA